MLVRLTVRMSRAARRHDSTRRAGPRRRESARGVGCHRGLLQRAVSAIEWPAWGPLPAAPPGEPGAQNEHEYESDDQSRDYGRTVTH